MIKRNKYNSIKNLFFSLDLINTNMSFYNVTTPSTFNVVSDKRFMLTQQSKMNRTSATLQFTGAASTSPYSTGTFSAQQLVAGVVFMMDYGGIPAGTQNVYLPSASDLITMLMGPGGFDVSNNDIFTFRLVNKHATAGNTVTVRPGTGGSGTPIVVPISSEALINIQISVVVSGAGTTYSYSIF